MKTQHQKIVYIDGEKANILIKTTGPRKTVKIEFKPPNIIISIPKGVDYDVDDLLSRRSNLIKRKYREALSKIKILDKNVILYKGHPYQITANQNSKPPKIRIHLKDDEMIIHVRKREKPKIILKNWITNQTKSMVDNIADKYSDQIGEEPTRISVTDTKRWGYCGNNKAIIFNWQLATLPPKLAEFIIIHELVHLIHLNHQKGFHAKMKRIIPDYKQREIKLKQYVALEPNFEYRNLTCTS